MTPEIWNAIIFWSLAVMTVVPAVLIMVVRDVIRCSMLLLATLSGVAGLFVLLGADFVGFVQILVYVGGILILLMFGVMLTNRDPVLLRRVRERGLLFEGLIAGAAMLIPLVYLITEIGWKVQGNLPEPEYTSRKIGLLLMTDFILPFEVISVLLLAALIGAAYIARMGREA
jgi:NADH-quinone oxidoreductase subunit J